MGGVADTTRTSIVSVTKSGIRRVRPLHTLLYRALLRRRTAQARQFMETGGLYPDDRAAILRDYAYACTYTHRGIGQALNLEGLVRYVVGAEIPGAIVECGTYTGGALAYTLRALIRSGDHSRDVYGFDSFAGMPRPTPADGDQGSFWILGKSLADAGPEEVSGRLVGSNVNRASYEQCLALLENSGYPGDRIRLVKGWFQETLPEAAETIGAIALLRLDGDLYESTRCALEALFDRVVPGGAVVLDDYGTFEGCRRAVDEFLAARSLTPHLVYVDLGVRFFIKG